MKNEHIERWIGANRMWWSWRRRRESRRRGVAGVRIWTPNCLFRHSGDRQRTAAKGLARLLCLLSKGPSIRLSDFRAIVLADSFPQIW